MSDATVDRLNAALEGRYRIERELGEGGPSNGRPMYDVSLNDSSFVMLRISDQAAATELIWVENWAEDLRERAGN